MLRNEVRAPGWSFVTIPLSIHIVCSHDTSVFIGWLDDIGLPQYKDQFHESRVDGRMLQYLTVVRIFP